MLKKSIGLKI